MSDQQPSSSAAAAAPAVEQPMTEDAAIKEHAQSRRGWSRSTKVTQERVLRRGRLRGGNQLYFSMSPATGHRRFVTVGSIVGKPHVRAALKSSVYQIIASAGDPARVRKLQQEAGQQFLQSADLFDIFLDGAEAQRLIAGVQIPGLKDQWKTFCTETRKGEGIEACLP